LHVNPSSLRSLVPMQKTETAEFFAISNVDSFGREH
jgi:hypothetical protein